MRPRLADMIDLRHELVKLAGLIDWEFFEEEWAGFFPSHTGRPATSPRLVAGLLYLQHAYRLSDEAVVARWVENPYYQHLCGETFFQHRPPVDPSSLTRWRNRIGEEGAEWLLTKTIEAGREAGVISERSAETVIVDTTVMEKAIAHPTDTRAPRFSTVLVPPRRRAWSEAGGRASAVALLRPDGRGAAAFTLGFFCLAA